MNVDVEIYMSEFVKFFKENPNDLIDLIGKAKQEDFFSGVSTGLPREVVRATAP